MASLPPRKVSASNKPSKQDTSTPLQILLQMGFPKHRALKALAATGDRSVQLASDWLLTHVNDASLDAELSREYILYACPSGNLMAQLQDFWDKSNSVCGWNGAHNFPPHITLVSFFKAPDECSLQLAKALKHVVESVGLPPNTPLKLEKYVSQNFMGLFLCEEHADYLKQIAVQYVKQVSSAMGLNMDTSEHLDTLVTCFPWCAPQQERQRRPVSLEPHVKSLHITLAYHFSVSMFEMLKCMVDKLKPFSDSAWQLRLYSRDPRFASHQVHKVTQVYQPKENDELELVLGDYVYIDEHELNNSPDGWVQGTSWLTGVTGYLPTVYVERTAESDAWTLHKAISLDANATDTKSESDSAAEPETEIGRVKTEESFREWGARWKAIYKEESSLNVLAGVAADGDMSNGDKVAQENGASTTDECKKSPKEEGERETRRWFFALRHGERVDLTYGSWVPFCFDGDKYIRKDLNMPLELPEREGGKEAFIKDSPLTRVGELQAFLVGEGLRDAGVPVRYVYSSPALRCVQTAHCCIEGMKADPSVKIRVEPSLFELKLWHLKGVGPFMTPIELHKAGYNIDLSYKPYAELDLDPNETVEEYYERSAAFTHHVYRDTQAEGGNIIFVGHATTLDCIWQTLRRCEEGICPDEEPPPYYLNKDLGRVPYCALAAIRDKPWALVEPPCPPSMHTSSGRYDWKLLFDKK